MKKVMLCLLIFAAFYSRLVGISWGLPYPMHPDERNMAVAVQSLTPQEQFNPHFFAYGQLPLYAAYVLIQLLSVVFHGTWVEHVTFESATLALRLLSAFASWGTLYVVYRLLRDFFSDYLDSYSTIILLYLFVLSPYAIQFAHFGTTESVLILLYMLIVYLTLKASNDKKISFSVIVSIGIVAGLAIGIKISSATFLLLPLCVITWSVFMNSDKLHTKMMRLLGIYVLLGVVSVVFMCISSPHIILSFTDFISSMRYESGVASGSLQVFYTRQFLFSIPIAYQVTRIFPVALGMGQFVLVGIGFLLLSYKDKRINILRIAILLYFIPSIFLFVKWTRFVAPILPIMSIFGALVIVKISKYKLVMLCLTIICIIPGIAYLSIYQQPDIRFKVSEWMYNNIPSTAHVFAEAGNVINIPVPPPYYNGVIPNLDILNFDFYSVDTSKELQDQLVDAMKHADYIIVSSRRITGSVTCALARLTYHDIYSGYSPDRCVHLKKLYPVSNEYYDKLLSSPSVGGLGFAPLKNFTAYPKIEFFGKTIIEFPDEHFDETWSVFDHPVIRIYKRI